MQRCLEPQLRADLRHKLVLLTGARQVGKTPLARQMMGHFEPRGAVQVLEAAPWLAQLAV